MYQNPINTLTEDRIRKLRDGQTMSVLLSVFALVISGAALVISVM